MHDKAADWKAEALEDFAQWLQELPPEQGPPEPDPARRDLAHLYGELAALRRETAIQNRLSKQALAEREESRSAIEAVRAHLETHRAEATGRRGAEFDPLALVLGLLDVRDALERSRSAAARLLAPRGILRRKPPEAKGLVEAFDLILRKFDRVLAERGIVRIESIGKPFDAATMNAVGVRHEAGAEEGTVVDEVRGGYLREGQVLRAAEVFVHRTASASEGNHEQ